jgi:hypothetical protein
MSRIKLLNCDERNILQYNSVLWLTVVFSTVYYCSYVKQYPMGLLIHKLNRFDTFVFAKTFDFYFEITPNFTFYFTAMRQVRSPLTDFLLYFCFKDFYKDRTIGILNPDHAKMTLRYLLHCEEFVCSFLPRLRAMRHKMKSTLIYARHGVNTYFANISVNSKT